MNQLFASQATGLAAAGIVLLFILMFACLAAILIFEIAMFIHALRNTGIDQQRRILWLVGMLLIHPIVAIVYYFTDYRAEQ